MKKVIYATLLLCLNTEIFASGFEDAANIEADNRYYTERVPVRQSNLGPVPDLAGSSDLFDELESAISSAAGALYNLFSFNTYMWTAWGPIEHQPSTTHNETTRQEEYPIDDETPLMPVFEAPKNKLEGMRPLEALQSIKHEDDCHPVFEYLKGSVTFIGFSSSNVHPSVIRHFVEFVTQNSQAFPKLRTLMWSGHNLDGQQIHDLLTYFTNREAFLCLTPGPDCDPNVLFALSLRHCLANKSLTISINGVIGEEQDTFLILPDFDADTPPLPKNFKLSGQAHRDDPEGLNVIKTILGMADEPARINLGNGKFLKL